MRTPFLMSTITKYSFVSLFTSNLWYFYSVKALSKYKNTSAYVKLFAEAYFSEFSREANKRNRRGCHDVYTAATVFLKAATLKLFHLYGLSFINICFRNIKISYKLIQRLKQ